MQNLPNKKYQIIYVDPPWRFKNYNDDTATRWVGKHYSLMSFEDICNIPIKTISGDNCILFLWATFPTLQQAFKLIERWGFTYKTVAFVWIKTNHNKSIFMGMGYWTRSNSEICLLATKGHPKRVNANVSQVVISKREEHSKKPDIIRNMIVTLVGNLPRIELFARQKIEGWDTWGLEVPKEIQRLLI